MQKGKGLLYFLAWLTSCLPVLSAIDHDQKFLFVLLELAIVVNEEFCPFIGLKRTTKH